MLDSVVVVNETIDEAKCTNKSCIIFKTDFEKTIDSVDWEYLVYIVEKLDLYAKWVKWIKRVFRILNSVNFSE